MKDVPYFKTWIFFFIIATIGGLIAGMMGGLILGVGLGAAGVELGENAGIIYNAIGWLLGLPISYYAFRWAVNEYIVKELVDGYKRPVVVSAEDRAES